MSSSLCASMRGEIGSRRAPGQRTRITVRAVPLVALAIAAGGLAVGTALAARSSVADTSPAMAVTPNWSGYVVTGSASSPVTYSSVTGTWTVPAATCNSPSTAGGSSTVWVGLGGYTTKSQEEVGTDSNCNAKNKPTYYAWFELLPYIAYNVPSNDTVSPGDTITGTVNILSTTLVQLQIQNQTQNWTSAGRSRSACRTLRPPSGSRRRRSPVCASSATRRISRTSARSR